MYRIGSRYLSLSIVICFLFATHAILLRSRPDIMNGPYRLHSTTQTTQPVATCYKDSTNCSVGRFPSELQEFSEGEIRNNMSLAVCDDQDWIDMPNFFLGLMYLANESRMDDENFETFLQGLQPIDTVASKQSNEIKQIRFLQRRQHVVKRFPHQANKSLIVIPSWCNMWPYTDDDCSWPKYTTAILHGTELCFWPFIPKQESDDDDKAKEVLNTKLWASKFNKNVTYVQRAMVAGGFFGNIWHAAIIFNSWCNVRHQKDIHFLVQDKEMPPFVKNIANALGIHDSHILHHAGPVVAESILLAPYHGNVDWSCLHGALSVTSDLERDTIIVYFRGWDDPNRNIPEPIHHQIVVKLSTDFPDLRIRTFSGNATFEDTKALFQRARLVIGPHGAGMVNTMFCKEGTPVIEFLTESFSPPFQVMGGQTFGLIWWPVLLQSFSAEEEILAALSLVKKAMRLL